MSAPTTVRRDAARARLPNATGVATSADGTPIAWDRYGDGDPTIVLLPSAPIIHSRQWKAQVPYLARRWRTITYDGGGNGLSGRPVQPEAFADDRFLADLVAVLDATGTERAVLVGLCVDGVWRAIRLAAEQPERLLGIVAFAAGVPRLSPPQPHYAEVVPRFDETADTYEGWA